MATATKKPVKVTKEAAKAAKRKALKEQAAKIGKVKIAKMQTALAEALKEAKKGSLSLKGLRGLFEAGTATGKKMGMLAEKLGKLQAEADEPKGELSDLIIDLQQDIGELAKALGMGGGAEEVPGEEPPAEDEEEVGDAGTGDGSMGGVGGSRMSPGMDVTGEGEDEEEGE